MTRRSPPLSRDRDPSGTTREEQKRAVGRHAAELVRDGMVLGLGTGSTADHFLDRLGERIREGLSVRGVPTSERTAARARSLHIPLVTLDACPRLDLAIDGADQVDPHGDLIKGLGGALYREKQVARAATQFVVIVDATKTVPRLGIGCPVPVEVDPASWESVAGALRDLGGSPRLRREADTPDTTDNANFLLDTDFGAVDDPAGLERAINALPGVLDNGLFPALAHRVLVGGPRGVREWSVPPRSPPG